MNKALKTRYPNLRNEKELAAAIEAICSDYGKVVHLSILPASRQPGQGSLACACFMRLSSPAAETELKHKLYVIRYLDDLCFFADVAESWSGRTM